MAYVLSGKGLTVLFGAPWTFRGTFRDTARPQRAVFSEFKLGRSTSLRNGPACTFPARKALVFDAIPVPVLQRILRQRCCPNYDHAKFLSIIQARVSPGRLDLPAPDSKQTRPDPAQ